jgi:hypothetical protein
MTPWPTKLWRATVVVALVLGGALADAGAAERDQFNTATQPVALEFSYDHRTR